LIAVVGFRPLGLRLIEIAAEAQRRTQVANARMAAVADSLPKTGRDCSRDHKHGFCCKGWLGNQRERCPAVLLFPVSWGNTELGR